MAGVLVGHLLRQLVAIESPLLSGGSWPELPFPHVAMPSRGWNLPFLVLG